MLFYKAGAMLFYKAGAMLFYKAGAMLFYKAGARVCVTEWRSGRQWRGNTLNKLS